MATCERCTSVLRKNWAFCPRCGNKADKTLPMDDLFKEIHEHFKEIDRLFGQDQHYDPSGVSIRVDKSTGKPEIELDLFGQTTPKLKKKLDVPFAMLLPKETVEDPLTTVRRMAQYIIYTLKLPGISAKKDVHIEQLDNTTEIKAYSKDKVYFKLLNISLPIANYRVNKDQLVIKFKPLGQ